MSVITFITQSKSNPFHTVLHTLRSDKRTSYFISKFHYFIIYIVRAYLFGRRDESHGKHNANLTTTPVLRNANAPSSTTANSCAIKKAIHLITGFKEKSRNHHHPN